MNDNAEIIRRLFDAFKTKNRGVADELLSDDFTFTSPYDDRIDKATYFERWPNSDRIRSHAIENIFVERK
jgi:ketosteroid isomerase-like protein